MIKLFLASLIFGCGLALAAPADLVSREFFELMTQAALNGDAKASANLGVFYHEGLGIERNYTEALRWLTQAATAGNVQAQFNLATMYAKGEGTERNPLLSVNWMQKAAEGGSADAQFALGTMFELGQGIKVDYAKAANFYLKAAEHGHARAQLSLGLLYQRGLGVPQDYLQAFAWINSALVSKQLSQTEQRKAEGYWIALKQSFDQATFEKARQLALSYLQKYKNKTALQA